MKLELNQQNKRNGMLAGAIVILLAAMFLFAKRADTADADSNNANATGVIAHPALTVTLSTAQSSTWDSMLSANGTVAAWQESIIGTELNGVRLVNVLVQVGDKVKRGQLLAHFSEGILATEMAQQNAALAEAEATLADAQSNARRAIQLKESGAISVQQINQYATVRNTASARVSAARASLRASHFRLQHARIVAPDDGVISSRSATVGAVAQSGQELFRLIRQGRLEWRAEVTAEESSRISIGQAASINTLDGSAIKGKVRMVAPTIDPQTRKALIYVDLIDNASKNLKPGMFAKGEFSLGESKALSLPASAIVMRDGYASVFVVDGTSKVKQVRVVIGRTQQGRVEIMSGLNAGANVKVVDSGAGFLADGDTVRVVATAGDVKPKAIKAASVSTPASGR